MSSFGACIFAMSYKSRILILNVVGILAFLSIPVLTSPDLNAQLDFLHVDGFRKDFTSYVLLLVFFYFNYYYFIPKYYFQKRKFLYVSFIIFSYCLIAWLPEIIFPHMHHMSPAMMDRPPMDGGPMHHPNHFLFDWPDGGSFFQFLLVLSLSFLLKINNQLSEMHSEKLKAEVSYLKAQINPHFLFNTLNSLYALTIEKSDAAPDAVLKLSNMMRYVVSESTKEFVPLEKEINYIKDYIDLQRLRITDEHNLEFSITGNPKGKSIAPLVAIPFIENAFKYGVNGEEDWKITVTITITDNLFTMDVYNKQVDVNLTDTTEQGIDNTEKRLDFIYPGTHELDISDTAEAFRVHLKIELL